jgi:hypothetical protein
MYPAHFDYWVQWINGLKAHGELSQLRTVRKDFSDKFPLTPGPLFFLLSHLASTLIFIRLLAFVSSCRIVVRVDFRRVEAFDQHPARAQANHLNL